MTLRKALAVMLLLAGTAVYAQMAPLEENVPQRPRFTKSQAELIIPRPLLQPVKSMIPGNAGAIDTLDTANPLVKLVLYSDNTWKYVKDGNLLKQEDYFTKNWNNQAMDPYGVDFKSLPDKVTLWLVDNPTDFCCPNQVKVFSKFGYRHKRRHQGCDLPLKTGDPVRAAFAGKVRISDWSRGYGNLIVIRHENGLETAYGHLSARNVKEGDWVSAGDIIGLGGSTGRSSGPHLHFETRYMGYAFDPEWLIDFETGTLRSGVFTLNKRYLNENSNYVPESEQEEEDILLAEVEDREAEAKQAAEQAARQFHTIKSGDTLGALAVRYHTTVRQLCAWNGIKQTTTLRIGQRLRVH